MQPIMFPMQFLNRGTFPFGFEKNKMTEFKGHEISFADGVDVWGDTRDNATIHPRDAGKLNNEQGRVPLVAGDYVSDEDAETKYTIFELKIPEIWTWREFVGVATQDLKLFEDMKRLRKEVNNVAYVIDYEFAKFDQWENNLDAVKSEDFIRENVYDISAQILIAAPPQNTRRLANVKLNAKDAIEYAIEGLKTLESIHENIGAHRDLNQWTLGLSDKTVQFGLPLLHLQAPGTPRAWREPNDTSSDGSCRVPHVFQVALAPALNAAYSRYPSPTPTEDQLQSADKWAVLISFLLTTVDASESYELEIELQIWAHNLFMHPSPFGKLEDSDEFKAFTNLLTEDTRTHFAQHLAAALI